MWTDMVEETAIFVKEMWDEADEDKDGNLNQSEWIAFSKIFD